MRSAKARAAAHPRIAARMRILMRRVACLFVLMPLALLGLAASCQCGEAPTRTRPENSQATSSEFATLVRFLDGLPETQAKHPVEFLPGDTTWTLFSDDIQAWLTTTEQSEWMRALKTTPLAEDLEAAPAFAALTSFRYQIARVTSFVGRPEDSDALWQGPVALASNALDAARPRFVVIKKLDPAVQTLARFAAAFAGVATEPPATMGGTEPAEAGATRPNVKTHQIAGVDVRTLQRRGEQIAFAFLRDYLILGSDPELVDRATALAMKAPLERQDAVTGKTFRDRSAPATAGEVLATPGTPGIHVVYRAAPDDLLALFGMTHVGFTLGVGATPEIHLRSAGGETPQPDALSLLRYAPATSFAAFLDGRKPAQAFMQALRQRVLQSGGARTVEIGKVDIEAQVMKHLDAGMALFLGAHESAEQTGAPGLVFALRHHDVATLEPLVRNVFDASTESPVERVILASLDDAVLLTTPQGGPAIALTKDALLLSMSADVLRTSIAAGMGQSRSLKDRGLNLDGTVAQAIFVDFAKASRFLTAFYRSAYATGSPSWDEVQPVLAPTFAVLERTGTYFARVQPQGDGFSEGVVRAVP